MTERSDTNTMCPAGAVPARPEELALEGIGFEEPDPEQEVNAALPATTVTATVQQRRQRRARSVALPSRFIADHLPPGNAAAPTAEYRPAAPVGGAYQFHPRYVYPVRGRADLVLPPCVEQ